MPTYQAFFRFPKIREWSGFTKLANDSQVPPSTVTEYVGLLEDTLIGFLLPAWIESTKRKAIKTGKFYFFHPGVTHTLAGTETLDRNSDLYEKSFEQVISMGLKAYLSYRRKKHHAPSVCPLAMAYLTHFQITADMLSINFPGGFNASHAGHGNIHDHHVANLLFDRSTQRLSQPYFIDILRKYDSPHALYPLKS
jgi:hypothetical protein